MITIITPTYNREKYLNKAYNSLLKQTDKDFEWIVIDDGSTDKTKKYIDKIKKDKKINIEYVYKENGGKHTALNLGIKKAKGELILILDSDDYLDQKAIEYIKTYWEKYKNNKQICGMTFLKKLKNPKYSEKKFEECISNMVEFRYNNNNLQDMCEVFKTDILKRFTFPVFGNEKFLSEVIVYNEISKVYDMAYIPETIYIAEYLDNGLSKSWIKLVVNNPQGARANSLKFMNDKRYKISIRIKNCLTFGIYSIISKQPVMKESKMKILSFISYIPCCVFAAYLILKYKERK